LPLSSHVQWQQENRWHPVTSSGNKWHLVTSSGNKWHSNVSVQNSYIGYNVSTCPEGLQTDRWNCGVWVAWVGSMRTTHVERGLEGTMDISKVIKVGLTSEGVSNINDHPSGKSYNESFILRIRRQFRQRIYDDDIPQQLIDWLDHWHTPLTDVQAVASLQARTYHESARMQEQRRHNK
jgi:hypothetical protein